MDSKHGASNVDAKPAGPSHTMAAMLGRGVTSLVAATKPTGATLHFPWGTRHRQSEPYLTSRLSIRERNYLRYLLNQNPTHRAKLILSLCGRRIPYVRKSLYSFRSQSQLRNRRNAERSLRLAEKLMAGIRVEHPYPVYQDKPTLIQTHQPDLKGP